jgi:hypothetical protein
MRLLSIRGFATVVSAAVVVFGVSGSSWARTVKTRVHAGLKSSMHLKAPSMFMHGEAVVPGVMPEEIAADGSAAVSPDEGKPYQLKMFNLHTGESLNVVYRIGNTYLPDALEKLNYFLRDHYTQDVSNYDPKEFDVLHAMMARLGKMDGVIDIVCGYRTPETNQALRQNSPQIGSKQRRQIIARTRRAHSSRSSGVVAGQ